MNRCSSFLATILMAVTIVGCSRVADDGVASSNSANDKPAIDKLRSAYAAAWTAGDAGAVANLYADDAMTFPGNQPTASGRDAILKSNEGFFTQFAPGKLELVPEETTLMGDWAFDRGSYHMMATPKAGGDALDTRGRYLVILHKQSDGTWKVARDFDNTEGAPGAAAAANPSSPAPVPPPQ